jgi:hypothetical protein
MSAIDMAPASTYLVRIEAWATDLEEFLGDAVGKQINAFEIVSRPTSADAIADLTDAEKIECLLAALSHAQISLHRGRDPNDGLPTIYLDSPDGTATVFNLNPSAVVND